MAVNVQPVPNTFFGKYKLSTSENFDNFLKEIGKWHYNMCYSCFLTADYVLFLVAKTRVIAVFALQDNGQE